ncbi:MAG: hypothetical protein Q8L15_18480 [Methylobacter sp.]|nr:hypothetical protein [Methylobacter sp.]
MKNTIKNSYTVAAASLTGHASNVTGSAWTIATAKAGDGLAHHVTIRNDAVVDHSAKTIVLTGFGPNGEAITEALAAPGISATVTSTKAFWSLASATPSATIDADTFDIGWAATAQTAWIDTNNTPAVAAVAIGGTINFDIQHTYDELNVDAVAFNSEAAKTANIEHLYTIPVRAVRVDVNSHTSGTFSLYVTQ